MTTQVQATSVSTSVEVEAPAGHAFRVFTDGIGSWWDPSHHILEADLAEPRKGHSRLVRVSSFVPLTVPCPLTARELR